MREFVTVLPDPRLGEYFVMQHTRTERRVLAKMPTWQDAYSLAVLFARIKHISVDRALTGSRACPLPRHR